MVRAPDGSVATDPGGKAAGRGAYVHADQACLRLAARAGSLGRALRRPLDAAQAATLLAELAEAASDGMADHDPVNVRGDER